MGRDHRARWRKPRDQSVDRFSFPEPPSGRHQQITISFSVRFRPFRGQNLPRESVIPRRGRRTRTPTSGPAAPTICSSPIPTTRAAAASLCVTTAGTWRRAPDAGLCDRGSRQRPPGHMVRGARPDCNRAGIAMAVYYGRGAGLCQARVRPLAAQMLSSRPASHAEIISAGRRSGFTSDTLRRAKERIGATSCREGFGPGSRLCWELPRSCTTPPADGIGGI